MDNEISRTLERARHAQTEFESFDQQSVDETVTAVGWSIVKPENNRLLAELAVSDTGLGNVDDKINKNRRKTMGLLRDLKGVRSVGVISENPARGIVRIARPVGVVGAIVPSTNPVATPVNKTLNALKGRNAIVLAPSPKGDKTCERLVHLMRAALERVGAPVNLVQKMPSPPGKAATGQLMESVDLVVATGSQSNVRAAYSSGTPAIGVGAGNVVSIIDETADIGEAAEKILVSKSFDHATSCSAENNLVIVEPVYQEVMHSLQQNGAVLLSGGEKRVLQKAMWKDGKLNPRIIAKSASTIARYAGLDRTGTGQARVLLVEEDRYGEQAPFSGEKLSPVLTVFKAPDFQGAKSIAEGILNYQGKGHSISLHSNSDDRAMELGLELPVCRVIVNQVHSFATGGAFNNGLPFSLSMGCGTWGGNSISENLQYRHYLNITRISRVIEDSEPIEEELFADYWEKYPARPPVKVP